ncbi:MAG: hypothetical protein ACI4RR_00720 [Eubacterium sp.]
MKDKFIRVISPITLLVVIVLDIAVIGFAVFTVKKIIEFTTVFVIIFAVFEAFALIVAALVTKEILTQGVIFRENELEFTALDENNIFTYSDIISVKTEKFDKASLVKNFNDRHSNIEFTLTGDSIITVDIGLTSKKTLKKLYDEILTRIK